MGTINYYLPSVHPDPLSPRHGVTYDTSTPKSDIQGPQTWTDTATAARERAAQLAAAATAALGAAVVSVYDEVSETAPKSVQERMPENLGTGLAGTSGSKDVDTMPVKETATLSQDKVDQQPGQGPMGGVDVLPGGRDEEAVALLPEEKGE